MRRRQAQHLQLLSARKGFGGGALKNERTGRVIFLCKAEKINPIAPARSREATDSPSGLPRVTVQWKENNLLFYCPFNRLNGHQIQTDSDGIPESRRVAVQSVLPSLNAISALKLGQLTSTGGL